MMRYYFVTFVSNIYYAMILYTDLFYMIHTLNFKEAKKENHRNCSVFKSSYLEQNVFERRNKT
jgi:hypothetical protein